MSSKVRFMLDRMIKIELCLCYQQFEMFFSWLYQPRSEMLLAVVIYHFTSKMTSIKTITCFFIFWKGYLCTNNVAEASQNRTRDQKQTEAVMLKDKKNETKEFVDHQSHLSEVAVGRRFSNSVFLKISR